MNTKLQRYEPNPEILVARLECSCLGNKPFMYEVADGKYVHLQDYANLQKNRDRWKELTHQNEQLLGESIQRERQSSALLKDVEGLVLAADNARVALKVTADTHPEISAYLRDYADHLAAALSKLGAGQDKV